MAITMTTESNKRMPTSFGAKTKHLIAREERRQLFILLFVVFLSFIGASIAYPIIPPLFLHKTGAHLIPLAWSDTTRRFFLGLTLAIFPLGQFIGAPILGRNADSYGRKKVLIFSLFGSILGYTLTALSLYSSSLGLLLFSLFLSGIMESTFPIARAIASDLTSIDKFVSFGQINTVAAMGYILGPLFGGIFSDKHLFSWFSYPLPFLLATLASIVALVFVYSKLPNQARSLSTPKRTLWQQLNLVRQFKNLFINYPELKKPLLISTMFTFSVDMFYEFGPVYLAGKWTMTPAQIALYNAALSLALALGAVWLPRHLSRQLSMKKIITIASMSTAAIFGCMTIFQYPIPMFILFALSGLSITTVTTTLSIHISNTAHPSIQGEAMGAQLSFRTLADAFICLIGGLMITSLSIISPIIISSMIAFVVGIFCIIYFASESSKI